MTTMRTTVVVGGTAGLGLGLAKARLAAGDRVAVLGRNTDRGAAFIEYAARADASDRATFVSADVSTVAGSWQAVRRLQDDIDVVDALVLTAYAPQLRRRLTEDGVEASLALYYVARRIFGDGLQPQLDKADRPVILSLNGVGVVHGDIHWDDLTLERRYRAVEATRQAGRAAELLAVEFARRTPPERARYVLAHPGFTRTGATGLPPLARAAAKIGALAAQSVERAIAPLLPVLDDPPAAPLTALDRGRPVPLESIVDNDEAVRLAAIMTPLVNGSGS